MATQRLSQLHQRILQWLAADHQRTRGFVVSSHEELVKAMQRDKGTISRSLRTLEARGWLVIGRSSGGKAQHLTLTPTVCLGVTSAVACTYGCGDGRIEPTRCALIGAALDDR